MLTKNCPSDHSLITNSINSIDNELIIIVITILSMKYGHLHTEMNRMRQNRKTAGFILYTITVHGRYTRSNSNKSAKVCPSVSAWLTSSNAQLTTTKKSSTKSHSRLHQQNQITATLQRPITDENNIKFSLYSIHELKKKIIIVLLLKLLLMFGMFRTGSDSSNQRLLLFDVRRKCRLGQCYRPHHSRGIFSFFLILFFFF